MQFSLLTKLGRFLLAGLLATMLQYGVLVVGVQAAGFSAPLSSGMGYVLSAGLNYYLNRRFTFRSSSPHWVAARRFAIVSSVGVLLNVSLMELLTSRLRVPYLLAQVVVTIAVLALNFGGSALWSFAPVVAASCDTVPGGRSR